MIKIITSIIICLFLSFGATTIISKSSKENWIMQLDYEHIERGLNINYILLANHLNVQFEGKFTNFISKLDTDISLKNNNNPCSKARGEKASPQLLTKYQDLRFQVTLVGKNKELILECEKYIDIKMKNFEKINLIIAQKLFLYKQSLNKNFTYTDDDDAEFFKKKEEAKELIKKDLIEFIYNKKKENKEGKESSQNINQLDNLLMTFVLTDLLNRKSKDYAIIDFNIMDLKLIKKISSTLIKKKESQILLFISAFIILQTIVILIFFRKTFFLKISNVKKIKRIITKIID